jgi:hypothetical protein
VETVDKFPADALRELNKTVDERGGLSFIIKDLTAQRKAVQELIKYAQKSYRYVDCMKYKIDVNSRETTADDLILGITFVDLIHCIPVYDARKVSGMGVLVAMFYQEGTERRGKLMHRNIYSAVFSDHEENLYKIDGGSKINEKGTFPSSLTSHFVSNIESEIRYVQDREKKVASGAAKKSPERTKAKRKYAKSTKMSYVSTINYASTSSTTSTW